MQQFKSWLRLTSCLLLMVTIFGCHNYYRLSNHKITDRSSAIDSFKNVMRYFVLRTPSQAWYMRNTILSNDRKLLTTTLDTLPQNHKVHLDNGHGKMRYKSVNAAILSEVHLYISDDKQLDVGSYSLSLDKILKIEVIEKNNKKTLNSYVIGTLGYTMGTIALAGAIIAATKSSCPFVSAYNGNAFVLQGEIFGGAIYPQLARHDYLPLQMAPASNGNLQVKISNELQERQFTDVAEMIVVKHKRNTKVITDVDGNLYNIQKPEAPVSAILCGKKDVRNYVITADEKLLYFDDSTIANGNNYVVLQFSKQQRDQKAKLVLSLKNSYWLDYLYGEFAHEFGSYYQNYTKQQSKKPAQQLIKGIKEQCIPLQVSLKTKDGWQELSQLTTVGPVGIRDIVVPLDLSMINKPMVEIKLSSGYLFWELDYVAIDYSTDETRAVEVLKAVAAHDEKGKDVMHFIGKEDATYLKQPVPGTVATIQYKWLPSNNKNETYTYILHTKGYYEHVRNFKGKPNTKFLAQFKKPGAFPLYSLQHFKDFQNQQMLSLNKK